MPNPSPSGFKSKRSNTRVKNSTKFQWNSFLPVLISLLGIGAWIAGEAFFSGYWNAVGVPGVTSMTLQQTAFAGFAAAYYNWTWIPLALGILALYVAILAIDFKSRRGVKILWIIKSKKWWDENIEIDKVLGKLFGSLLIAAILFSLFVLAPLTLWVMKAMEDGGNLFRKQACTIKATETLPSTIKLDNGTIISGKILDRSENLVVILTRTSIDVIAIGGANSRLLDSTTLKAFKCT